MGWCNGEDTQSLMNFAIFDIETRIDKALIQSVMYPHEDVTEEEAYQRFRQQIRAERDNHSDFLPIAFHVPISIVVGNVAGDYTLTAVEVLCAQDYSEEGIVCEFWRRVEIFPGTLVSFNGRAFDLPVLEMQALRYGCQAPRYFNEKYGHRYRYSEERHYDLFDFLSNVGAHRIRGGFNLLARLIGLPGKTWVDGSMIQGLWEAGQLSLIHTYCRQDVIQTYGLFLRIELMRGRLTSEAYRAAWDAAAPFRAELSEIPGGARAVANRVDALAGQEGTRGGAQPAANS
jgi:predicted PolB exonuclease-like 3'-5' exonuclease